MVCAWNLDLGIWLRTQTLNQVLTRVTGCRLAKSKHSPRNLNEESQRCGQLASSVYFLAKETFLSRNTRGGGILNRPLFSEERHLSGRLAVIVSTYNARDTLARVLDCYLRQAHFPDELIVADDGSSDGTGEMVADRSDIAGFPIRHVWQQDEVFPACPNPQSRCWAHRPLHCFHRRRLSAPPLLCGRTMRQSKARSLHPRQAHPGGQGDFSVF